MEINELFDQARRNLAREYNRIDKLYSRISFIINIIFLFLVFYFSLEIRGFESLKSSISNRELLIFIYLFLFYLLYSAFSTILDYFFDYKLNRRFELYSQNSREWLIDEVKSFLLGLVLFYLAVRTYLFLTDNVPQLWWLYYTIIASLFSVLLTFIFPTVLLPIFFKLESYPESELKTKLLGLINKADLEIDDIYEINLSTKVNAANAAVMGIGSSRKVVLGDRLKERYSSDEIESVLAHELGHQVHGDIFKNILLEPAVFLFISYIVFRVWPIISSTYGYNSYNSIYSIPLLLVFVSILSWLISPITLLISRINEKRADKYAVCLLGEGEYLASALAKLADESLAPLEVNLYNRYFKLSHPPIKERLEYILNE